jgi:L-rhamnose isomerase
MTIEIHRPELKALIMERMKIGGFQSVEDALMQALKTSPATDAKPATAAQNRTGADLIAAMQSSPYRELEIEPARYAMPVRDFKF